MPSALSTRRDLEQELLRCRAILLRAERAYDTTQAQAARDRCDRILDLMLNLR